MALDVARRGAVREQAGVAKAPQVTTTVVPDASVATSRSPSLTPAVASWPERNRRMLSVPGWGLLAVPRSDRYAEPPVAEEIARHKPG